MIDPGFARLRLDAIAVLEQWQHPDPGQCRLRDEYLAHLRVHGDGMSRSCRSAHVTASALLMDEARSRVLLTLHPKVGRWLQLGGHCEAADAGLRGAAEREAVEESGIAEVAVSPVPMRLDRHEVRCGDGVSVHLDVQYLVVVSGDARERISEESIDLRWFSIEALPEVDSSVARLIEQAVSTG